jgi:excinuclease UvrABC nuclease subunit
MLELDCCLEFDSERDEIFFAALPARPGVLLLEMREAGAEPYLARTADVRRAAERLLRELEAASKRLNLRNVAARVRYRVTGSKLEQTLALYDCARARFPRRYRDLLRLRPPAVLKVNLRNEYPRCYVTRRILADGGFYLGPFASRKGAEAFAEGFLDLFKIRRCQIKIRRDPEFPGCIYSEMKMCLAPCFAGCTKTEYDVETGRVVATLASSGEALTEELERDREAASDALDFERAAAVHKRLEKASAALRGLPEVARRIDELDAVILQRAAEEKTIIAFPVLAGLLAEPIFIRFGELSSEPRSVEAILKQGLERQLDPDSPDASQEVQPPEKNAPNGEQQSAASTDWPSQYGLRYAPAQRSEHLAILARWFYSKPREGEIFFRDDGWPYRRILRACGRLLAPPPSNPSAEPSA